MARPYTGSEVASGITLTVISLIASYFCSGSQMGTATRFQGTWHDWVFQYINRRLCEGRCIVSNPALPSPKCCPTAPESAATHIILDVESFLVGLFVYWVILFGPDTSLLDISRSTSSQRTRRRVQSIHYTPDICARGRGSQGFGNTRTFCWCCSARSQHKGHQDRVRRMGYVDGGWGQNDPGCRSLYALSSDSLTLLIQFCRYYSELGRAQRRSCPRRWGS